MLLATDYPVIGSSLIERELSYLKNGFQRIIIISYLSNNDKVVPPKLNKGVEFYSIGRKDSFQIKLKSLLSFTSWVFWEEIFVILKKLRIKWSFGVLFTALRSLELSYFIQVEIENICKNEKILLDHNTVFYSYWWDNSAIAASTLKLKYKSIKAITRAHRADLIFEDTSFGYLPYKYFMLNTLNFVYVISDLSRQYLLRFFKCHKRDKILVKYLATYGYGYTFNVNRQPLNLFSCSSLVKLKRVELIIEAIEKIPYPIIWTHIGSGNEENKIKSLAKNKLSKKGNISYSFLGSLPNEQVISFFKEKNVDLFINVSEIEGLPVSIMEAFSFGVPAIATNVGSVSELVNECTGYLLDKNCDSNEIAQSIIDFHDLADEAKKAMSNAAFNIWEKRFNADVNYQSFSKEISSL